MYKMCSDERKCAVMKGCLCSDELRRNKWCMQYELLREHKARCRNVKTACGCVYIRGVYCAKIGIKFLKKVVLRFFGQMCSDEFFLKHALPPIVISFYLSICLYIYLHARVSDWSSVCLS